MLNLAGQHISTVTTGRIAALGATGTILQLNIDPSATVLFLSTEGVAVRVSATPQMDGATMAPNTYYVIPARSALRIPVQSAVAGYATMPSIWVAGDAATAPLSWMLQFGAT